MSWRESCDTIRDHDGQAALPIRSPPVFPPAAAVSIHARGVPAVNEGPAGSEGCLSVVMPVYNEGKTVHQIIERVLQQPMVLELIIVNDCSTDETRSVLEAIARGEARIRLFHHEVNQGKGAALRTGFQQARAEVVIIQDADLEYDPSEYHKLLKPILSGRADVVYGSRFLGSEAHRVLYYWHSVGNYFLTQLSNMLSNLNLTDMETCYKAFRREIIQKINIEEDRFGFEPEITAKLARFSPRLRIYEVAVSYYGRTYEEGKKIGWRDGVAALFSIFKYNLSGQKSS
jgi:glycosyltransferase involved in cell wall biosynthesis